MLATGLLLLALAAIVPDAAAVPPLCQHQGDGQACVCVGQDPCASSTPWHCWTADGHVYVCAWNE